MLIYFFIIFFLYYIFVLLLLYGWRKIAAQKNAQKSGDSVLFVTIVVAVRNEAKNISRLLKSLESQNYPRDRFEIIIIDDGSEDNTAEIIHEFANKSKTNLRFACATDAKMTTSSKKAALSMGVSMANGSIIVTTDGDCWMRSDWLTSMVGVFSNPRIMFASGPVVIDPGKDLYSQVQSMEFSSLIGSGAALIHLNYPLLCNGANLAFRKEAFLSVGGYAGVDQHASGDDVFLMQKIHAKYPNSILFTKDSEALVYTRPLRTFSELIMQRRRWASKWNSYNLSFSWLLPVFLFFHYLTFLMILIAPIIWPGLFLSGGALILIKFILDFMFLKKVMSFCNLRMRFEVFLISEFVYPLYAIVIGIFVHFGKWNWKGRKHKT